MRYKVLVTDYDGTIASEGVVSQTTVAALAHARDAGLRLVLVTGRKLSGLLNTFGRADLFDRIVAENGAVLYHPATQSLVRLGSPPPPALIEALVRERVPFSVGQSIVATVIPYEHQVLAAIRDLGLEWHVIFNKGAVMALPAEVTKATGLALALAELQIAHQNAVGVGDAENDQAFLRLCGLAVAVDNALPAVKAGADIVTRGARGDGVTELINQLLSGELDSVVPDALKSTPARQTVIARSVADGVDRSTTS